MPREPEAPLRVPLADGEVADFSEIGSRHAWVAGRFMVSKWPDKRVTVSPPSPDLLLVMEKLTACYLALSAVVDLTPTELRLIRRLAGMKQEELADVLAIARETLSRYETGKEAMPRPIVLAVKFLGIHATVQFAREAPEWFSRGNRQFARNPLRYYGTTDLTFKLPRGQFLILK